MKIILQMFGQLKLFNLSTFVVIFEQFCLKRMSVHSKT